MHFIFSTQNLNLVLCFVLMVLERAFSRSRLNLLRLRCTLSRFFTRAAMHCTYTRCVLCFAFVGFQATRVVTTK